MLYDPVIPEHIFIIGFSTLRRNLRENRLSMKNDRLNSILMIKINLPVLRTVLFDCDQQIIDAAVTKYYKAKKWRWDLRPSPKVIFDTAAEKDASFGLPPPKKIRLQDSADVDENDWSDENVTDDDDGRDDSEDSDGA